MYMFHFFRRGRHHKKKESHQIVDWGSPRWWGNWGSARITQIRKQITQITDWGRPNRTNRSSRKQRFHRELRVGVGIAGATALLVLIIFALAFYGAGALRRFIERSMFSNLIIRLQELENKTPAPATVSQSTSSSAPYIPSSPAAVPIPPSIPSIPGAPPSPNVLYSTFYAGFSGTGWLNTNQTSLYRDDNESAIMFPPKYIVSQLQSAPSAAFPDTVAETERACIAGRCLSRNGLQLFFDGSPLPLPDAVQNKFVAHVSIAALDSKWIVGIVTSDGGQYAGYVFLFDGSAFLPTLDVQGTSNVPAPLVPSQYKGVWGFGGTENDFLAVYGAYDGKAVQIHYSLKTKTYSLVNISQFFPIRVMANGFRPAVIQEVQPPPEVGPPTVISVNQPAISGNQKTWYVFSLTDQKPKFIKLWENGTGTIQGGADLTGSVLPSGTATALLAAAQLDGGRPALFIKATKGDGSTSYYKFIDEGFDKSVARMVVSSNINNYPWSVARAAIASASTGSGAGTIAFALSPDGVSWRDAPVGQMVELNDASSTRLFWRGVFSPSSDPMSSPFLSVVKVESQINRPSQ